MLDITSYLRIVLPAVLMLFWLYVQAQDAVIDGVRYTNFDKIWQENGGIGISWKDMIIYVPVMIKSFSPIMQLNMSVDSQRQVEARVIYNDYSNWQWSVWNFPIFLQGNTFFQEFSIDLSSIWSKIDWSKYVWLLFPGESSLIIK